MWQQQDDRQVIRPSASTARMYYLGPDTEPKENRSPGASEGWKSQTLNDNNAGELNWKMDW